MKRYENEYDKIYFLDSNWEIDPKKIEGLKAEIVRIGPHERYYDAYKKFLPEVKEDLVLLMDNDMLVYRTGIIGSAFLKMNEGYGAASIFDTIGDWTFSQFNGKSKVCPYFFCTRKELLMKYRDCEWGPAMPQHETLGMLSKGMADDGVKVFEFEEDKSNCLFDGTKDGEKSKNLGYYHIRAGSVPAVLLAYKDNDEDQYWSYLNTQPKTEYLRQFVWYWYMCRRIAPLDSPMHIKAIEDILRDCGIKRSSQWREYVERFIEYHGLL